MAIWRHDWDLLALDWTYTVVYTSNMIDLNKEQENPSSGRSRFSKTSVFGKFPWFNAMFKIKSLWYKDLILNSTGCRKNNRFLRQPAHYRIFAKQKYATVLQKYDTVSVPCAEREVPRATLQRARSAKFPAQDFRVSPMPRVSPFLFYYTLLSWERPIILICNYRNQLPIN